MFGGYGRSFAAAPITIKLVVVGLWLLLVVFVIAAANVAHPTTGSAAYRAGRVFGAFLPCLLPLYSAFALTRMSRWAVMILGLLLIGMALGVGLSARPFDAGFLVFVSVPAIVFLAMTVPYWRRLNWAFFGRSTEAIQTATVEDVFD